MRLVPVGLQTAVVKRPKRRFPKPELRLRRDAGDVGQASSLSLAHDRLEAYPTRPLYS